MMDPSSLLPREEIERLFSIESAREKAAAEYARSPLDAENLTKWGGVLLELAQFRQGQPAIDMVEEAIKKFEEALQLDPRNHNTLWCLGNAYSSEGFLVSDSGRAYILFRQATQCFQRALDEDPDNALYLRALEMSLRAPSLFHEMRKQQQGAPGLGMKSSNAATSKGGKKKLLSDLKYDFFGWVFVALGVAAWVAMAKAGLPPPPRIR